MKKLFKPFILLAPLVLAACGGGGGSGGDTQLQYSIKLSASKTSVPVNLNSTTPGFGGDYYPYMSTIYVQANEGGSPIPDKEDNAFGCNVTSGLDSGSLYYLDGKDEHTMEVDDGKGGTIKVPGSYRSITLGSNSGGASFHVISKRIAGDVVVACSVTDPRDNKVYASTVTVKVGGGSTATPAGVTYSAQTNYLGSRNNVNNVPNQVAVEATVRNDANQPISNTGKPNLQVAIIPNGTSSGARLMANGQNSGGSLQVSTLNGIGQFSVASGPSTGALLLQLTVDRSDNDVSNGIQDAITQYAVLQVVDGIATSALAVDTTQLTMNAVSGEAFAQAVVAKGGVPPYTWSATSTLPPGLTLSPSGLVSGTPKVSKAADYNAVVTVKDANGVTATGTLVIKVTVPDAPVAFSINGCSSSTARCLLPTAEVGSSYLYSFSATGDNITWSLTGGPSWLTVSPSGVISSGKLLTCTDVGEYNFSVTAKNSTSSVSREVKVTITDSADSCKVDQP
ncbi:hypothetical protein HNP33_001534 [Comamonas odontotermitis]|uniref:Uncharacterized protein n=1 Tax=Comamonas odontotermitis TaxID=379895 RepID=A0ABR6RE91_9BURK|nr:putative Ig domain-containing protein [Comamonas odontotermitis]MBB6577478.1 hypothetical protein [Comamonas odontotermitis]